MRNQISGSISLDVSSLADAIAERLNRPAAPVAVWTPLTPEERTNLLAEALANATGLQSHGDAGLMVEFLRSRGVVLARLPEPTKSPAEPADWFQRTTD